MVAETYLLGQQSGLATKELERVRPSLAISFLTLAMGSMPSSTTSWSSVRMNTKFGRFFWIDGYIEENFVPGFPLLPQHSKYFPSFMETISTFGNTSKCSLSFKYFFFYRRMWTGDSTIIKHGQNWYLPCASYCFVIVKKKTIRKYTYWQSIIKATKYLFVSSFKWSPKRKLTFMYWALSSLCIWLGEDQYMTDTNTANPKKR